MSNFDSDGSGDNEWDERGELAWNEFDWEKYLREQDESVTRYIGFYDALAGDDRIDEAAELMGWGHGDWTEEDGRDDPVSEEADADDGDEDDEVYTLHKNPIFIATKGICLSLERRWLTIATHADKVPQPLALALQSSLHRGEEHAVQAIHALDFGDYAMAVSLLKRALGSLNHTLSLLNANQAPSPAFGRFRDEAFPRLFDLREIWLRVINECRDELSRPREEEN